MKVKMLPENSGPQTNGIARVISAYHKYLPKYGVEYVNNNDYDLLATHAGAGETMCDVAHLHGMYWTADYDAPDWEYATNAKVIASARSAKVITVPSEWVAKTIRRDMRINPIVVPHGVDWDEWQGVKDRLNYVLYNKNRQGDVCDATPVSLLASARPDIQFLSTFGVNAPSNVKVTGVMAHDKMKQVVQYAGIYFAPTKETFGIGILEAMAAGVPVLGYAHGGILDIVEHGVNGYLVEPGDIDDLLVGLDYCIRYNKTLSDNCRYKAKEFTWDKVAELVAKVYQSALEEQEPSVSIIIPTFNYGTMVGNAIRSAQAQTYPKLAEIIVVDDGSTDDTDISSYLDDTRVKYIKQTNQGVANARNNGIMATNSKYICCLDADDTLEPTFLEETIHALEEDRTLGIAYTGLNLTSERGKRPGAWPGQANYDKQVSGQNQVPTCCVFRREAWRRLGGYKQRYAPLGCGTEDAEFWLRIGSIGYNAEKVTDKRLFNYTLGGRTSEQNYGEVDWLDWHPWTSDAQFPFASVATPANHSHPVRQYDMPIVSIIIPVGPGHEQHVIEALDSLEAQTMRQWEGIVVWDCLSNIPDYLQDAYPHIKWYKTIGEIGAGAARNTGARLAVAPFLIFLDADDWLLPRALEIMLEAYSENESVVYGESFGVRAVDEETAKTYSNRGELINYKNGIATVHQPIADYNYELAIRQPFSDPPYFWCYVSSLVPKVWHDEVGGFNETLEAWEDWEYWIRLAKAGKDFTAVHTPLITYCYDTGQRREIGKAIKDDLRAELVRLHEGVQVMACKRCGSKSVRNIAPAQLPSSERMISKMSDEEFVLVEYTPSRGGSHGVVGIAKFSNKTSDNMRKVSGGWVHYYGYRSRGDKFYVHRADQASMPDWFRPVVTQAAQRVISLPTPTQLKATTPEPVRIAPSEEYSVLPAFDEEEVIEEEKEFDLQSIPGVTYANAKALKLAGYDTREKLVAAREEDLAALKGISAEKAASIVAYFKQKPDIQSVLDEIKAKLGG